MGTRRRERTTVTVNAGGSDTGSAMWILNFSCCFKLKSLNIAKYISTRDSWPDLVNRAPEGTPQPEGPLYLS